MSMKSPFYGKILGGHQTLADIKRYLQILIFSIFSIHLSFSSVTLRDTLAEYLKTEIKICIQHCSVVASQNSIANHVI